MSKSAIARGASMAADVWGWLDDKVKAKGGTEAALHILAKKEGESLLDAIADLLVKAELKSRNRFPVTVNYDRSWEDMVKAGEYDFVYENITAKNFPVEGQGTIETEIMLIHFDRVVLNSNWAIREMEDVGLRPATLPELLALGAKYPDLQREYPIIALGSTWVRPFGDRRVPCLGFWHASRGIRLSWCGLGWPGDSRFAAVRK